MVRLVLLCCSLLVTCPPVCDLQTCGNNTFSEQSNSSGGCSSGISVSTCNSSNSSRSSSRSRKSSCASSKATADVTSQPPLSNPPETAPQTPGGRKEHWMSVEGMIQVARQRGMDLTLQQIWPWYKIECREGTGPEKGKLLGITTGFVLPLVGLMHCGSMEVFTTGSKGARGQGSSRAAMGLGQLLRGTVFSYGNSMGCKTAEILAIRDDDYQNERLVRYYSYCGFKPVLRVGDNGLSDLPHLVIWGGEGMRMDADIPSMLDKLSPALQRELQAGAKQ